MIEEVFFLGSGFSKAINSKFPTLRELSEEILGEDFSKITDKYNISTFPKSGKDNIEILLSYLSSPFPWKTKEQELKDKALYVYIVNRIKNIFYNLSMQEGANTNPNYKNFEFLWQYIMTKGSPIITLNYDLICEIYLSLAVKYNPRLNGYVKSYSDYANFYRGQIVDVETTTELLDAVEYMPEIIKLHGSCNWYYSGDDLYSKIYFANTSDSIIKNIIGGYSPYIIPPITDKTIFYKNQTIKYLWIKAYQYLQQAKKIYIIGFSFPPTDLSVKLLFETALKQNKKAKIVVVNTKESLDKTCSTYIKTRYNEIFNDSEIDYKYCCDNSLELFTKSLQVNIEQEVNNAK